MDFELIGWGGVGGGDVREWFPSGLCVCVCVCLGFNGFGKKDCVREIVVFVWGEGRYDLGELINK